MNRRLLFAAATLLLWLSPVIAARAADKPAKPTRSAVDPSYDVLLPDPEPQDTTARSGGGASESEGQDLDIADRVLSAAKQVTTVQEAPSIITVVRADEIAARGYRNINQVLEVIPGWQQAVTGGTLFPFPLVRGTAQAALLLRDGVSMFEPTLNIAAFNRTIPLETLKSVEVVTGPGGVLWGANSFLGIVNLISKDADDINGVEMGAGYGDGEGTRQDFRTWVLFGKSFRFKRGPKLSIVQHISAETFETQNYEALLTVSRSAAPSPPGPQIWEGTGVATPARAWFVVIDGKISLGPVTLSYAAPFGQMNSSLSTGSNLASGLFDTAKGMPAGQPTTNFVNTFDRYLTLQYKDRFLKDRVGLDAKLYGIQFNREINFVVLPGSIANPPGLNLATPVTSYRYGFSVDGDVTLPFHNRLLFGGDIFHEQVSDTDLTLSIDNPAQLPLNCPLDTGSTYAKPVYKPGCPLPFVFGADRTVLAFYVSDQFRPISKLILDGGLRYQAGFGKRGYRGGNAGDNGYILGSASVVWNFLSEMFLKANYSSGFRPPVFNNTDSNGAAVQFGGNSQLQNETSQAFQGELNARLLKNVGPIRALQFRLDYAYTQLNNLIVIANGSYTNSRQDSSNQSQLLVNAGKLSADAERSKRFIHSIESTARLYAGDGVFTLGYTFMYITTNDRGLFRSMPEHTFSLGWVQPIVKWLDVNGTFLLIGAYEDPDRVRTISTPLSPTTLATVANFSDITYDRLPPQAQLNLGLRAHFYKNRLWSSINFFNVLNQRVYYPDVFNDQAPTLEVVPNPAPGWSFFLQVGGKPW